MASSSSPSTNAAGAAAGGGAANTINDYLQASTSGEHNSSSMAGYGGYQQAGPVMNLMSSDISAFLMTAGAISSRSTPGSPAAFRGGNGGLGFHSVRTSPILAPSMPQSPANSGMLLNGGFVGNLGTHPMFAGFDSTVHSAVQSANASPIVGAFNRRGLLNGMANLNMAQLPPTAMTYMDT
ncbi:hypothetical protein IWW38_006399, partial [Coemansia aciculifera]